MNISEIAKLSGVSSAAVSRYFNNGYISEEKKEAIRKVVEQTGYRPSIQAQTLRTKKTKMIGVIVPKFALWSAGRGMFSVARGLNRVNGRGRRHWYVFNRLICCGYTILFIAVCLMSMGLLVFGRTLQNFIQSHFPLIAPFTGYVIQLRQLWGAAILLIFFLGIYCLVPDQKESVKVALPGAVFSTTGWMLFSLAFSLYFNFTGGKNYSYMYGSLAAIALSFLWFYICICILFMGAEINWFWDEI